MFSKHDQIRGYDDELLAAMDAEEARQEDHLELIASENYTSKRVMQAQGSGLTNKYAEGYPGKRYYGGCEHVDKVEQLAIDRARQLFGADYANVQPHSGSSANAAAYLALLNAGDTILGMSLAHGGHLTHGAKVSSSGKLYNAVQYGLDTATGLIDYDEVERLAVEHKPKMIVAGFSAYSKTLDFPRFRAIADKVGALLFVDIHHLTHGAKVSSSGKLYNAVQYGLDTATGLIDYDEVERLAVEHKPKMIVAGFSAYSKTLDFPRFRAIADKVGALLFVDMAHVAGLVAAGLYPNPIPFADVVTTTTHKTLRGPRGGLILARANEEIEKKLNSAVFPGAQGGPLMHVIAAKAVCFKEALEPGFKDYQAQVIRNAKAMAEVFIGRGYDVVSGGTDNHLMLISLVRQGLTGKEADAALGRVGITVNKNAVPNDPQSPFVTSGIRIGTPAITTRGLQEAQSRELAGWICDILDHLGDADVEAKVATQVAGLCADFPVYR
ncbi:serine hydroxymethyltransferase [Pseudomonas aeruginosa]|nr:serine hydroxymethyltransferase [Pseudomonas aeruginosa]TEE99670.1 serine hydroxymethyltransferase [Pseudomonas aeruginosa]